MDLFSLQEKTAIVTGALGLIGQKHCEALAMAGANVVVAENTAKNIVVMSLFFILKILNF